MSDFGNQLRHARESRSVSLDDVAKSTKISKRHLLELEEERFKELPGGIFNKGFVRAYSKALGLDEEKMVRAYLQAEAETMAQVTPPIAIETQKLMASMAVAKEREESVRPSDPSARFLAAAVALVILLGVGGYAWKYYEESRGAATASAAEPAAKPAPVMAQPHSVAAPVATPVAAAEQTVKQEAGNAPVQHGVFIELRAKADSWLQVSADGRDPVEMMLTAQQSKKFFAEKQLVMKLGNAEGVEITRNGKPLPPFAEGTKTQTLTFTPEL